MSLGFAAGLLVLCIVVQGFFSGSEIALVSADRHKLMADADRGSRGAALALRMLERPGWTLGACLVGTNLCTISAATLAASVVTTQLHLPALAATLLVVPFTVTFGEMVPKAIYQHHADHLVRLIVFPLQVVALIFSPLLGLIEAINRLLGGAGKGYGSAITRQELRLLLDGDKVEDLTAQDRDMIRRVFAFTEARVEEAMVPLIRVIAVRHDAPASEIVLRMTESGHSRLPVFRDRVDRVCGVVLHQDLLANDDPERPAEALARPPYFVPETKRADELLLEMRRGRQRIAVAVDEYGGAVGIITIEDILEEIVGEIEDESDRATPMVRRVGEREWLAAGRAEREHLAQSCGLSLPEGDFETIAGFILGRLGRIPAPGELLRHDGFDLHVHRASDRAITEVKLRRHR